MILDALAHPVVLAPMAGGPSTPALAAAVSEAGGLGFLAIAYLDPETAAQRLAETEALTATAFGVNLFVPGSGPADPATVAPYAERIAGGSGGAAGDPRWDDDGWEAKLALLRERPPAVVSVTFGCPSPEVIAELQSVGAEVWVTVTSPPEAAAAEQAGADVLVVQGAEAGGHRGSFTDRPDLPSIGLIALLDLVRGASGLPLVASGGITTGRALAAVLATGARAGQIGTAFLLSPEAGTVPAMREALALDRPTVLTRAFTGRLARGIRNAFIDEHDAAAPIAYPEIHHLTAPIRAAARAAGDPERINLWAGEAHALARAEPAAAIVRRIADEARAALEAAAKAYPPPPS